MRKTFRYRLYPTREQADALNHQIDEACRLYNAALQERRDAWRTARKSLGYYEQANQLRDIRADGSTDLANFSCCQDVLRRLDKAFAGFFRRHKAGQKAGYPRFRSRHRYDSITFPSYGDGCRLLEHRRLRVQGVGEVAVRLHRPLDGRVKTVSVKREAGQWFVLFSVECDTAPLPESAESVGIDVGLTTFATLSDGTEIQNPRFFREGQRRLRVAQRRVARRKKGSHSRRKAVRLLQRAHVHIRNQRQDFAHKAARSIADRYGLIAVEDLNIKGLAGSMLAKSVHDAAWGMFLSHLSDKAECAGRTFVRVDPRNTTQACSGCGSIVPKALSQRQHCCPDCGLSMGRDLNAAKNILRLGCSRGAPTWGSGPSVAPEAVCFS